MSVRQRILMVHPSILLDICKRGTDKVKIIKDALPEDAKFIRAFYDERRSYGMIGFVIESSSFDEVNDGEIIPETPGPIFEKIYDKVNT